MRRSSSTTSMCGFSAMIADDAGLLDSVTNTFPVPGAYQMIEDRAAIVMRLLVRLRERPLNALYLWGHQPPTKFLPFLGEKEQPLAAVDLAFFLVDVAFSNQLLQ